jgi:hypothetical protein
VSGRPLELVELGPSGGLDLQWDRYRYRYHSASTQYLSDDAFARLELAIAQAGDRGPLAWVSMEPPRGTPFAPFVLEVQQWPGGERRRLAEIQYHGAGIRWLA